MVEQLKNVPNGYPRRQVVYRDALAVKLGGWVNEPIGAMGDRLNVVVERRDRGICEIWEVKYAGVNMRTGMMRLDDADWRYDTPLERKLCLQLILSADRMQNKREVERINEHRPHWERSGIEIQLLRERKLPDTYYVAGIDYPDRGRILDECELIAKRFLASAGFVRMQDFDFLLDLADGYCQRSHKCRAKRVSMREVERGVVFVVETNQGTKYPSAVEMVRAWMELTHYGWIYGSVSVEASAS